MEFLIVIGIILIYATMQTIILKKKIEQTIPISVVSIILIIYILGLFDNLKLGVILVEIMAIIQLAIILYILCKQKDEKVLKGILKRIFTPGLIVYIALCGVFIYVDRGRIFLDYDEFTHWGVIIKNMFMYNTYGTNPETVVRFNEYPPFTAIFQYLFLAVKRVYSEDVVITAQNILYLSIVIPVMKNVSWNKKLVKTIAIIPMVILVPMIFYKNFYLDILVDGILGIMFAMTIFYSFENEDNQDFKYIKIFTCIIMLCLTKTSGIALAVLAILIIIIREIINRKKNPQNFKKAITKIFVIIILAVIFTGTWYIKVSSAAKRWDFNQYIEVENKGQEDINQIKSEFVNKVFSGAMITERGLTVFAVFLIFICSNFFVLKKAKEKGLNEYRYYSIAMLVSIVIYMVFLLITYISIFDSSEATRLTCFDRYCSTILLANAMLQVFTLCELEIDVNIKTITIICAIIVSLLPQENINERYIKPKNHIYKSELVRDWDTKLRNYTSMLNINDSILYVSGLDSDSKVIASINQYEIMPIKITDSTVGEFASAEDLSQILSNGEYTHVFIHKMENRIKDKVKSLFENNYVGDDILYKIINKDGEIFLERVKY